MSATHTMCFTRPFNLIPPVPTPAHWTLSSQSVKRVAERAADIRLSRDVLRRVMHACSASRKHVMRRAKAAGNQSSAREAIRSNASLAANQDGGGGDAGGGGSPLFSPRLLHLEHFVLELDEAVGNVEGIDMSVRQRLVSAARSPA